MKNRPSAVNGYKGGYSNNIASELDIQGKSVISNSKLTYL